MIGEQENIRLETRRLLDRQRLGRHIALLDRLPVGDERRGVEAEWLHLLVAKAVFGLHPLEEGRDAVLRQQNVVRALEILETVEPLARMAHEDLRIFLEMGRHDHRRNILLDGREGLDHAAAHVEVELADRHQHAVGGARAPGHDGDLEPVFLEGSIRDGLIIAAVLGLGDPVRAERDLRQGGRVTAAGAGANSGQQAEQAGMIVVMGRSSVAGGAKLRSDPLLGVPAQLGKLPKPAWRHHSTDQGYVHVSVSARLPARRNARRSVDWPGSSLHVHRDAKAARMLVGHDEAVGDLAVRQGRNQLNLLRVGQIIAEVAAREIDDEAAMRGVAGRVGAAGARRRQEGVDDLPARDAFR